MKKPTYSQAEKMLKGKQSISCNGKTYIICEENDIPQGKMDLLHAISNLQYWTWLGLKVDIK